MNTPTRLGSYAIGLVALFGAAADVGKIVGSGGAASSDGHAQHTSGRQDMAEWAPAAPRPTTYRED